MKTINIPAEGRGGNPFHGILNGVEFFIPRGVDVSVPDEVAALVENTLYRPISTGSGYTDDPRILPIVSASDNGKILRVVDGKWVASAETVELPAVGTDDNGKILAVSSGKWAAAAAPTELPAVTGDDDDKVLTVVSGAWAAAALPGGGD